MGQRKVKHENVVGLNILLKFFFPPEETEIDATKQEKKGGGTIWQRARAREGILSLEPRSALRSAAQQKARVLHTDASFLSPNCLFTDPQVETRLTCLALKGRNSCRHRCSALKHRAAACMSARILHHPVIGKRERKEEREGDKSQRERLRRGERKEEVERETGVRERGREKKRGGQRGERESESEQERERERVRADRRQS